MPFRWTVNPYRGCTHACVFCFARPTHTYLGFDAGRDFEREIVVKVNAPELLRAELARASWKGEHVALGTNTDPYQWVEGRYRLMEGIWQALRDARNPCSVLTKSPAAAARPDADAQIADSAELHAHACRSRRSTRRPGAKPSRTRPNPRARLEAVAELNRAGIPTGVLIAPLMPGINDAPEQVEPLLERDRRGGRDEHRRDRAAPARRGQRRLHGLDARRSGPELVPRYEQLYGKRAYAPQHERERLSRMVSRGGRPGAFWRSRALEGRDADTGHPPERSSAERRRARRASRRSSERGAQRLSRCPAAICVGICHPSRSGGRSARRSPARGSRRPCSTRSGSGATSISPLLRSIPRHDRSRDLLGGARADARRQLHVGVGEHAGVADEAGEARS